MDGWGECVGSRYRVVGEVYRDEFRTAGSGVRHAGGLGLVD